MSNLYYTPPTNSQFEELKRVAIAHWLERYPEETSPFYAKEKVDRIKDIQNIDDNFMYMVAMFDIQNQRLIAPKLSEETRKAIRDRMVDGGSPEFLIAF